MGILKVVCDWYGMSVDYRVDYLGFETIWLNVFMILFDLL